MALGAACSPSERNDGGDGDPGVDAAMPRGDASGSADAASSTGGGADATGSTLTPTVFPIQGTSTTSSPVIADVTVSCHAMYNPRILRIRVVTTDPQGTSDRGSSSGTLELPDGTNVVLELPEPYASSPYEERVYFGSGENLTIAQFDQACAAQYLEMSLTILDKTGHATIAPSVVVAPTVGGAL